MIAIRREYQFLFLFLFFNFKYDQNYEFEEALQEVFDMFFGPPQIRLMVTNPASGIRSALTPTPNGNMPAMLEDVLAQHIPSPTSLPSFYSHNRGHSGDVSPSASGSGSLSPSPPLDSLPASLPSSITPRLVTLRDRITSATLIPILSSSEIPPGLLAHLCAQFNLEIEKGDTYPLLEPLSVSAFGEYWFQNFGAVMLSGDIVGGKDQLWTLEEAGQDWHKLCLGTFYIKPNYPGRSSHVCNGGFIVTNAARNKGVGRLMGEAYLAWAPKLVSLALMKPCLQSWLIPHPHRPLFFLDFL